MRSFNSNYTAYLIDMTSQKWLDTSFIDRPIWTHTMAIIVPGELRYNDTAFLYVGSGYNGEEPRDWSNGEFTMAAQVAEAFEKYGDSARISFERACTSFASMTS